jgi:protein-S-isoprenylcysteine O-methyltransferase Ste14
MTRSRSTPRVRLIAALLALAIGVVAVSERNALRGLAGDLAQLAGLACIVIATGWRVWASVFIAGVKDATLVSTGPYSACRHPLYAGSLLAIFGSGLATRSVTLTVLLLAVSAVLHARAVSAEDKLLSQTHGAAFDRFRREVPALWPDFRRYAVPESLTIQPQILRKAFFDAGSILGAYLLIRVADLLQTAGVTPTLLQLP